MSITVSTVFQTFFISVLAFLSKGWILSTRNLSTPAYYDISSEELSWLTFLVGSVYIVTCA
jgi:hypothetical protein